MADPIYELTTTDRLCFNCPLPDCDETDPRCLRNQALGDRRAERREYHRLYQQRRRHELAAASS